MYPWPSYSSTYQDGSFVQTRQKQADTESDAWDGTREARQLLLDRPADMLASFLVILQAVWSSVCRYWRQRVCSAVPIFDILWFCDLLWHLQTKTGATDTLCCFFNAVNSRLGVCTTKARIRNICAQRFTARHENESWRIQKWVELQQSSSLNVFSCVSTLGLGERWREETEEDCSGLHFNFIQRQKTVRRVQWNMYIYIRIIEFNTPLQTKTWTK